MSAEELQELIDTLATAPETIANLAKDLSDGNLRHRNSPEEFSAIETVCRLRDIEAEGYTVRINRILSEDDPVLPDIDGGRLALERNYQGQNLDEALEAFAGARAANVRTLRALREEQLSRAGTLEGVGVVSLGGLLELMLEHDHGHIDDLRIIHRRFRQQVSAF